MRLAQTRRLSELIPGRLRCWPSAPVGRPQALAHAGTGGEAPPVSLLHIGPHAVGPSAWPTLRSRIRTTATAPELVAAWLATKRSPYTPGRLPEGPNPVGQLARRAS